MKDNVANKASENGALSVTTMGMISSANIPVKRMSCKTLVINISALFRAQLAFSTATFYYIVEKTIIRIIREVHKIFCSPSIAICFKYVRFFYEFAL